MFLRHDVPLRSKLPTVTWRLSTSGATKDIFILISNSPLGLTYLVFVSISDYSLVNFFLLSSMYVTQKYRFVSVLLLLWQIISHSTPFSSWIMHLTCNKIYIKALLIIRLPFCHTKNSILLLRHDVPVSIYYKKGILTIRLFHSNVEDILYILRYV
jgi:hypothetical protein